MFGGGFVDECSANSNKDHIILLVLSEWMNECMLWLVEAYHQENGNIEQYLTLQHFKGCDVAQLLMSGDNALANVELNDYYALLAASHTSTSTEANVFFFLFLLLLLLTFIRYKFEKKNAAKVPIGWLENF